ncbi:hypothetical protein [Pelagibius sp.]|uniref:hypothetical protein n=1 Tax=Pelagibius sp. TaxID=1931238 RepID=UPI002629C91A|nr:hypothetical protein [Pelagibius sp.]
MTDGSDFSFAVLDIFQFADGRTLFTGRVEGEVGWIREGLYDLVVDGRKIQQLKLEGENIPKKLAPSDLRSISTRDSVDVSKEMLSNHLVAISPARTSD